MTIAKVALRFVIFVDVSGQGLIVPLIYRLAMDPSSPLLPADTPRAQRHFSFGLIVLGRAITGFTSGNQPIAQAH